MAIRVIQQWRICNYVDAYVSWKHDTLLWPASIHHSTGTLNNFFRVTNPYNPSKSTHFIWYTFWTQEMYKISCVYNYNHRVELIFTFSKIAMTSLNMLVLGQNFAPMIPGTATWIYCIQCRTQKLRTHKYFQNRIKSNLNEIVFTICRLIWNTNGRFRLFQINIFYICIMSSDKNKR